MGDKTESTVLTFIEGWLTPLLDKSGDAWFEDPKFYIGMVMALCGLSLLARLIAIGPALRPDFGYSYFSEKYLVWVSYGFTLWRWGYNFITLNAVQYNLQYTFSFHCTILFPIFVITIEKTIFMLTMRHNNWISDNYFNADVEGQDATSRMVSLTSIYERFDQYNAFKLTLVVLLQGALLLFYTCALQTSVTNHSAPFPYLFWITSFLVQEVSDLIGVFGQDFDFPYWAFMTKYAGNVTLQSLETKIKATPSAVAVYTHFFFALSFEMFGRSLLIMTLPLFLMTSETPMEYMLNCLATGFFALMSQVQSGGRYKVRMSDEYDPDEDESEDENEEEASLLVSGGSLPELFFGKPKGT